MAFGQLWCGWRAAFLPVLCFLAGCCFMGWIVLIYSFVFWCFLVTLLCLAASPLDSFPWTLQTVIHPQGWELVRLTPPINSLSPASSGTSAVCH